MKIVISPYSQKLRNGKPNPKNWPYWKELVGLLREEYIPETFPDGTSGYYYGHKIVQIGVEGEEPLVEKYYFNKSVKELTNIASQADLFISVDNFSQHFFHYLGKRGIVLFSRSDPSIFGYPENANLLKDKSYLRPDQFGQWESCDMIPESFVEPQKVLEALKDFSYIIK